MAGRVELVRLDPVVNQQAVEQALQILESARWRGVLRRLEERQERKEPAEQ